MLQEKTLIATVKQALQEKNPVEYERLHNSGELDRLVKIRADEAMEMALYLREQARLATVTPIDQTGRAQQQNEKDRLVDQIAIAYATDFLVPGN